MLKFFRCKDVVNLVLKKTYFFLKLIKYSRYDDLKSSIFFNNVLKDNNFKYEL